jgi:hypothetical protein
MQVCQAVDAGIDVFVTQLSGTRIRAQLAFGPAAGFGAVTEQSIGTVGIHAAPQALIVGLVTYPTWAGIPTQVTRANATHTRFNTAAP